MAYQHLPPFAPGSISLRIYLHDGLSAQNIVGQQMKQARQAAKVGFDGIMMGEHHGGFPGYIPNTIQTAGFMLGAMDGGWVAPAPVLLPLRPWALVAEDMAWLSARFPGRVGLGVGTGSLESDFDIMEVPKEGHIDRFLHAFGHIAEALRGRSEGELGQDPAILACADAPVPILAASASPRGCRFAASVQAGLLFESITPPPRLRELAQIYHDHGGTGPIVLIRRVWAGEGSFERQERQIGVYGSYGSRELMKHWGENQLINGTPDAIADQLAEAAHAVGADAINLRVHVPGVMPEEVEAQIDALAPMLPLLRAAHPWKQRG
ncbi:alkanesulfonate monooxygenase SsuD/methylene tetrahydromethanopterin reductase-like flavin-dependent oxidoreductase (luciferase family) [Sphingobium sp. OAS761]|uniref:LLM class flavin-dependent oxidoreductase n=1 Tax=Sphingobium sp. OAS761 TaxID=2817901 RepID=UPI00209F75A7|nr:LLM class flavin-dependent oxidoreductase [Sphingobium sp. OAS761]MCP1470355.1 alkanesulfonate monooxygenase SsuD/methylene tetrahydromethanopterin reductase-like flavin-dependent oxidoreductase (luciferase family) [Sphingobium sp. OAS761]